MERLRNRPAISGRDKLKFEVSKEVQRLKREGRIMTKDRHEILLRRAVRKALSPYKYKHRKMAQTIKKARTMF